VSIEGATVSTTSTQCTDSTLNGTNTDGAANGLPNNGGTNPYGIHGNALTFSSTSDSGIPFDGEWTFMRM
jgi:hypothetical protein